MQIVELGDCSMVIMKDSNDTPWESVGDIYRKAEKYQGGILVEKVDDYSVSQLSRDYVYTGGRLVLFFKNNIDNRFSLHDKVNLRIWITGRARKY